MEWRVGTSGFAYKEWKGEFYPEDIASSAMLSFYASRLTSVEINNTFYRLPRESVLEGWAGQVGDGFRFAIKASRRITHIKRLKDPGDETEYLFRVLAVMGEKLGCVLFQLPPNMKKDLERLGAFLGMLPPGVRCAFEFRHESWLDGEVLERLRASNCALVMADTDESPVTEIVPTADWGYLRLRKDSYNATALRAWSNRIEGQGWKAAYVFFKHEGQASPSTAEAMLASVGRSA